MTSTLQLAFLFKATMLILSEWGIDPYTGNNRLDTRCVRWYSRESDRRPWGHRTDLETEPACVVVRPRHQAFVGLCQYFWVPAELVCFYEVCNGRQRLPAWMHLIIYQYSKVTWETTRQERIIRYWTGVWGTADSWQEKAVPYFPLKIDFWGYKRDKKRMSETAWWVVNPTLMITCHGLQSEDESSRIIVADLFDLGLVFVRQNHGKKKPNPSAH